MNNYHLSKTKNSYCLVFGLLMSPFLFAQKNIDFPKINGNVNKMNDVNSKNKLAWERKVFYIGNAIDTISIVENTSVLLSDYKKGFTKNQIRSLYYQPFKAESSVSISIDTSQLLSLPDFLWNGNKYVKKNYTAYPALIKNNSDSSITIGFGDQIPVIVEAMDKDNKWKSIEKHFIYKCGTGLTAVYLKSHDIIGVLVNKYQGSFKTLLRLRLGDSISAPFEGTINRSQFK